MNEVKKEKRESSTKSSIQDNAKAENDVLSNKIQ